MVEKKEKTESSEPKAKAPKKVSAAKAGSTVKKESSVKSKEVAAPKASKPVASSGKTLTLIQTGSPIGRQGYQRDTLIGLGLNKIHRTRTLIDTPSVRGMIEKVKHLVKVVE